MVDMIADASEGREGITCIRFITRIPSQPNKSGQIKEPDNGLEVRADGNSNCVRMFLVAKLQISNLSHLYYLNYFTVFITHFCDFVIN